MEDPQSFVESLFDFSFSSFVTTKIVKVLYGLSIAAVVLVTLSIIITGFAAGIGAGIAALLIGAPLFLVLGLIYARVMLELIVVMFRIAENVAVIAGQGGLNAAPAPANAAANDASAADTPADADAVNDDHQDNASATDGFGANASDE